MIVGRCDSPADRRELNPQPNNLQLIWKGSGHVENHQSSHTQADASGNKIFTVMSSSCNTPADHAALSLVCTSAICAGCIHKVPLWHCCAHAIHLQALQKPSHSNGVIREESPLQKLYGRIVTTRDPNHAPAPGSSCKTPDSLSV